MRFSRMALLLLVSLTPGLAGAGPVRVLCFGLLRPQRIEVRSLEGLLPLRLEAEDGPPTLVLLGQGESLSCRFLARGGIEVEGSAGTPPLQARRGRRLVMFDGHPVFETRLKGIPPRQFRGRLGIEADEACLRCRLLVTEKDYVAAVAAAEMGGQAPQEALSALAVVIRSSLRYEASRHRAADVDRCDNTHCALFRGMGDGSPAARELWRRASSAVEATGDAVLCDGGGRAWPVWYSAACGGRSVPPRWVWPHAPPMPSNALPCPACSIDPRPWRARIPEAVLREIFFPKGEGSLRLLPDHGPGDYLRQIVLRRGVDRRRLRGEAFRIVVGRRLGWNRLRSNVFRITRQETSFLFEGRGFGHSVGLCQAAAMYLADQGLPWRSILRQAFPPATLERASTPTR